MKSDEGFYADIEELASLPGITKEDIALYFGYTLDGFETLMASDILLKNAFDKGRLVAKVEFTKKIKQLSNQGSGPAQSLLLKLKHEEEFKELRSKYR